MIYGVWTPPGPPAPWTAAGAWPHAVRRYNVNRNPAGRRAGTRKEAAPFSSMAIGKSAAGLTADPADRELPAFVAGRRAVAWLQSLAMLLERSTCRRRGEAVPLAQGLEALHRLWLRQRADDRAVYRQRRQRGVDLAPGAGPAPEGGRPLLDVHRSGVDHRHRERPRLPGGLPAAGARHRPRGRRADGDIELRGVAERRRRGRTLSPDLPGESPRAPGRRGTSSTRPRPASRSG